MAIFFTADQHFGHARILEYCNRPFTDINHMHRELIARWNAVVTADDTVYVLGDFALGCRPFVQGMVLRLNGNKIIVKGNHDRSAKSLLECGFKEVHKQLTLTMDGKWVSMSHRPPNTMEVMGAFIQETVWLHGHSHGKLEPSRLYCKEHTVIDVGVDAHDFTPRTLKELIG